jgi:hypothetical protein
MKGFYVSEKSPVAKHSESKKSIAKIDPKKLLTASVDARALSDDQHERILPPDSCNDLIYFVSGASARVSIVSDSGGLVKYIICDKKNGKIYTSQKKDIQKIKTQNPVMRVEGEQEVQAPVKAINIFALIAFISALISTVFFFAGLIVAWSVFTLITLIFGITGLAQIASNPKKYRSKWLIIFPFVYVITIFALYIYLILTFAG